VPFKERYQALAGTAGGGGGWEDTPEEREELLLALDAALSDGLPCYAAALAAAPHAPALLAAASDAWRGAAAAVGQQSQRLADVLETFVLPVNAHTRYRGATKGSVLYLPGVIRAVTSDWNHKKIYASRCTGGKRVAQVCICVDVSSSMAGQRLQAAQEGAVMAIEALVNCGLEDFCVIAFAGGVQLVKGPDTPWGPETQLALLRAFAAGAGGPAGRAATLDAAAVDAAAALMAAARPKPGAERLALVFTDGLGTTGVRLAGALARATDSRVRVVGVGLGFDATFVPATYQRWATAALPRDLPDALQALFSQDEPSAGGAPVPPAAAPGGAGAGLVPVRRGAAESLDGLLQVQLEGQARLFTGLVRALGDEVEAKVLHTQPDDMSVDVCFAIDVTGSMSGWIEACKAQVGWDGGFVSTRAAAERLVKVYEMASNG
jgi:hypothetical protein